MQRNHLRLFVVFIIVLALFSACAGQQKPKIETYRITVLHFNDLHGYIQAHRSADGRNDVGGASRLYALIEQIRAQNDAIGVPTILLFAGDLLQGSPVSSVFKGEATVEMLNRLDLTAAVPGNHEYDFGQDNFDKLVEKAKFPFIVCNLRKKNHDTPWLPMGMVKRFRSGLRVGIVGVTSPELVTSTHPRNVADLIVDDPISELRMQVKRHDMGSDLLIVLSHCGIATDRQIADAYPDIDVIVGGHNHNLYEQPVDENGVMIVQAGEYGEYLGRMDLEVTEDRAKLVRYKVYPIAPDLPQDKITQSMVDGYMSTIDERSKTVIGEAMAELDGRRETVRRVESNLGDFVCDAIRTRFGADVVLLNGGGFRGSIAQGSVTVGDVLRVFPFGNTLYSVNATGSAIRAAIERGLQEDPADNPGSFLQVSGLSYEIENRHAVNIKVGYAPLVDEQVYKVVINDFMAAGGDRFVMLKDLPNSVDTGYTLADVVIEEMQKMGKIEAKTDGRIKRTAPWAAN